MKKLFWSLILAFTVMSCSSDKDDSSADTISDQTLTGTVEGKAFTVQGGKAFFRSSTSTEEITIYLTNENFGCDSDIFDYTLTINASVPNMVGVYTDVNIVTQDGNNTPFNNLTETIVEITAVSDTEISGKMKLNKEGSEAFPESIFEGAFTVSICE
ncbi:hypothetical protein I2486_02815 [Cellulophaga sp. E16_2]|uniref:hypothetical protein n=1 Tax=Cellulophaga sp. E16_2 TaxID=2789297 RepID=UPI001A9296BD|nr:hypothetical protein [Cellulophaga sp. E16_2]MBO0590328.1 hypothetical protein [Cellulophaga sp. E16_2]